jgi:hypothetical protein
MGEKRPLTPTTCKTWGPLRLAVPPLPKGEGCELLSMCTIEGDQSRGTELYLWL